MRGEGEIEEGEGVDSSPEERRCGVWRDVSGDRRHLRKEKRRKKPRRNGMDEKGVEGYEGG